MELFLIYLWLKLDTFLAGLQFIFVSGLGIYALGWFPRIVEGFDQEYVQKENLLVKLFCKWHTRLLFISLIAGLFHLILPSSKDTAILVGSAIAIDMAKSPEGQKIGSLIRGKANEFLDAELKKLQPQPAN